MIYEQTELDLSIKYVPKNKHINIFIPASRFTDADSSHIAENKCDITGQREKVLDTLKELSGNKEYYYTATEISAFKSLDRHMVSRRLPELEKILLVERKHDPLGKEVLRKCCVNGTKMCQWRIKG